MKVKTIFRCRECGQHSTRWLGRCPGCGARVGLSCLWTRKPLPPVICTR